MPRPLHTAIQPSPEKLRFADVDFISVLLWFPFASDFYLRRPPPPPTSTASRLRPRSHAGGAAAAVGARARSVVIPCTSAEGIPVSATATREIPASYTIRSASAAS